MNKRENYLDIAKGFAILFLFVNHLPYVNYWPYAWVLMWDLPVFLFCTGLFLHIETPIGEFVKKKARQLLIPYLVVAVVLTLLQIPKCLITGNISELGRELLIEILTFLGGTHGLIFAGIELKSVGTIWYLPAVFLATIFTKILGKHKFGWIGTIVLAVASIWSYKCINLPFGIQQAGLSTLFVYAGVIAKQRGFLNIFQDRNKTIAIATIGTILGVIVSYFNIYIEIVDVCIFGGILSFIMAFVAGAGILGISKLLSNENITGLVFWGKNSLYVLCIDCIFSKAINKTDLIEKAEAYGIPLIVAQIVLLFIEVLISYVFVKLWLKFRLKLKK